MGADVLDLTSRLARPKPAESCRACRPGRVCHPHRVAALSRRLHGITDRDADALLIPRQTLDDVLADVLEVLDGITRELGIDDERTAR